MGSGKILSSIEDLGIFGGQPFFAEKLHVGRPNIGNRDRLLVRFCEILDNRWLTNNGPLVQQLERRIEQLLGVKHCIAICNATIALEIAVRAVGLTGEVIIPSFTFVATAHALQWQEITPVFCDITPTNHTIDPFRIEGMITPKTTGIIGVHLWGQACDIDAITQVAIKHNLKLLFDAAHSFACSYKGKMIGNFGDAEVFSFHATKFVNSFEGGAITTNNDDLAEKIRLMKNFGFAGYDNVIHVGTNGKMSEISAAMGLTSIESLDEFVSINYQNYNTYRCNLLDVPGVRLLHYNESERSNYQYIVMEIDERVAKINRDQLLSILWAENVLARRYFFPGCHRMEPYHSFFPHSGLLLPETERLVERILTLPNGTVVSPDDIATICGIIKFAVENGEKINFKLICNNSC